MLHRLFFKLVLDGVLILEVLKSLVAHLRSLQLSSDIAISGALFVILNPSPDLKRLGLLQVNNSVPFYVIG
jgi:hypothetical protein